jgi:flavoprotein, HI0933 family
MKHIVIIGAGASGCLCAIELAKKNKDIKIHLIEKNNRIAKKILATGNGRCNLSNLKVEPCFYHGDIDDFYPSIVGFDVIEYFSSLGLLTRNIDSLIYPYSFQAKSVVNIFEKHLRKYQNIEIYLEHEVIKVEAINNKSLKVISNKNLEITADYLVIATGGLASIREQKAGYTLVEQLGYQIENLSPSLVQIRTNPYYKDLKGVKIKAKVSLFRFNKLIRSELGEVLLTDYGISGICILQLSSEIEYSKIHDYTIHIDLFNDLSVNQLTKLLKNNINLLKTKKTANILEGLLPLELANKIPSIFNIKIIDFDSCHGLSNNLKNWIFKVDGTMGFLQAQVTKGGIKGYDVNENFALKQSFDVVYACGEVLNIDGDCGGYNLHFAFSSGYRVAKAILGKL